MEFTNEIIAAAVGLVLPPIVDILNIWIDARPWNEVVESRLKTLMSLFISAGCGALITLALQTGDIVTNIALVMAVMNGSYQLGWKYSETRDKLKGEHGL